MNRAQTKNIANLLKRRIPRNVFSIVRRIGRLAEEQGLSAYIVGGFVRDLLLGAGNLDLDIVVEGEAIALAKLLKNEMKLDIVTHPRFGTARLTLADGFKIDLASARKEYYAHPAALPAVELSSIRQDLFRRDFTINALAIKINRHNFGELLDLFGAEQDLKAGKIMVLHDKSFIDDPTRIFRAVRFEQRYNFAIERHTLKLIKQANRSGMLQRLTKYRLDKEIGLILKESRPLKGLRRLSDLCGLNYKKWL